jgi:aldose sugar dehydrogenase
LCLIIALYISEITYAATNVCSNFQCKTPLISDAHLKLEIVYQGNHTLLKSQDARFLSPVTKMAMLGKDDILLLNKNDGKVMRILNHTLLPQPLIDLSVANKWERGLLGIAIMRDAGKVYSFLYYTGSKTGDGSDVCPTNVCLSSTEPIQNKLYRYELNNNKLINPKYFFSGPPSNIASHNGGALTVGPDDNIYLTVGDLQGYRNKTTTSMAQNFKNGKFPDGRASILRFTPDGKAVGNGILGNKYPLNLYYAYGIRNSFGIDFDPVSGKLWDTENGPEYGDEINLVSPGFNSGWIIVQGIWQHRDLSNIGKIVLDQPRGLLDFNGTGKYSAPEFVWNHTVGPTALRFLNSDKLGGNYKNDLFVASFNLGEIYHFDLNQNRSALMLPNPSSTLAEDQDPKSLSFAKGLGNIVDMQVGPDGDLYILSNYYKRPTIFKISN